VGELESSGVSECVAVDLIGKRCRVFDHEITHVSPHVEMVGGLNAATLERSGE
tara:strand:- start:38 stop:196 length:159 start_codon:yes stop_codon:yes gene_type:complete